MRSSNCKWHDYPQMDATGHAALADRALGRQVILPRCTGSFNISKYESGLQLYCTATVSHRVLRRVVLGRASAFDRRRDPLAARRRLGRGLWVLFGGRLTRRRAKTPIADMIARRVGTPPNQKAVVFHNSHVLMSTLARVRAPKPGCDRVVQQSSFVWTPSLVRATTIHE